MKAVRFITFFLALAIAFSVWTPSAVYAGPANSSAHNQIEKPKSTIVKLSITNKTGGILYVRLTGDGRSYFFSATNPGKNTFEMLPGRYTYTITTSACSGSVTKTRKFQGGSSSLGAWKCYK